MTSPSPIFYPKTWTLFKRKYSKSDSVVVYMQEGNAQDGLIKLSFTWLLQRDVCEHYQKLKLRGVPSDLDNVTRIHKYECDLRALW